MKLALSQLPRAAALVVALGFGFVLSELLWNGDVRDFDPTHAANLAEREEALDSSDPASIVRPAGTALERTSVEPAQAQATPPRPATESASHDFGAHGSCLLFNGVTLDEATDEEIAEHIVRAHDMLLERSRALTVHEAKLHDALSQLAALGEGESRLADWLRTMDPSHWPDPKTRRMMYRWTDVNLPADWTHEDLLWLAEKIRDNSWVRGGMTSEEETLGYLLGSGRQLDLTDERWSELAERYPGYTF